MDTELDRHGGTQQYTGRATEWFAGCSYGLGLHWTAQTMPLRGQRVPFEKAVDRFRLDSLLDQIERSGAEYIIFTCTHALQMLPCPCEAVETILPGRTSKRDLLGELALGLRSMGKHLILYYNHSCNRGDDPAWEHAVGYHDIDKEPLVKNLCSIVGELGNRYRDLVRAWWFDSSYSLDPRGPENTVSTEMKGFQFPWERWSKSARSGFADRLVTFNAGINRNFLYTHHQDFWAGEIRDLSTPPTSRFLPNGLQWHGWTCLEDRGWLHTRTDTPAPPPLYSPDELATFVSVCREHRAPMTFNVIIYQDGTVAAASVDAMATLRERLGSGRQGRPPQGSLAPGN